MGTKAKNKEKSIIADSTLEFQQLMMQYDCAMLEVKTKLEVLNKELSLVHSRTIFFAYVQTRIFFTRLESVNKR